MATDELEETPLPEAEGEPTAEAAVTDDGDAADGPWENAEDEVGAAAVRGWYESEFAAAEENEAPRQ